MPSKMNNFASITAPFLQSQQQFLFKDEKINTVIAVLVLVWIGIVLYLIFSGRKLKKIEGEVASLRQIGNQSRSGGVEKGSSIEISQVRSRTEGKKGDWEKDNREKGGEAFNNKGEKKDE